MKNKLLGGLISLLSLFLFKTLNAQAPVADFSLMQTTVCAGTSVQITDLSTNSPSSWSYTMTGGNPASSVVQNPATTFNSAGIYTISLIATNANGPSAVISKTISVNALPILTVSGSSSLCAGSSITRTVTGADTYTWSTGENTDNKMFNPVASGNYTVTGTNTTTSCWSSVSFSITVESLPVLSITGNSAVCMGSAITQTVSGADTYTWTGIGAGNTITVSPIIATTYSVTGSNTLSGCTNSTTVLISVDALPVLSISGNTSVCNGSSINQTVTGADTYLWSNGSTSDIASFNLVSSGTISVTGTNTLTGCSAPASASITVHALPSLTLSGNTAFCSGTSATQTVSGADTYLWSTGNSSDTETFSPVSNTDYTVTGTNTLTGCSNSAIVSITVNALPVLSVSGGSAVCIGSGITQTVSGADTYTWTGLGSGNTITVSPVTNSTYTVTGTNILTGCTGSTTLTVFVNALPVVSIAGGNTVCTGSAITQTANGADTYVWSDASTGDVATFNPLSSGLFSVTGTNTLTGCSAPASVSLTAIALPGLSLSGPSAFCVGGSAIRKASGADTYVWSTGATIDTEIFAPVTSTNYTVTGTNTLTGCSNSMTFAITVNSLPVLSVNGSSAVCLGSATSQTVTGADTYTWSNGFMGNVASLNPTVVTIYTIDGTNTLTGCSNSTTLVIRVDALPVISIAGNTTLCAGSVLTQTANGGDTYLWSDGSTGASPAFTLANSSTLSVTGTNTLTGCSSTASVSISAIGLPILSLNGINSFCAGGSATQTVSGADAYLWSTGSVADTETFTPASTSSYTVTGTNTLTGCSNMAQISITVNPLPTITVSDGTVCAGDIFTMNPGGASTYTFSNGASTVIPVSNASYSITGTSSLGCISSNTAVASVTVHALPVIAANNGTICTGDTFTINPTGASTYTFSSTNATVSPVSNTSYTVIGTSTAGCISAGAATVNITVNALPVISVSGNTLVCAGDISTLTASGANTYTWNGTVVNTSITLGPVANITCSVTGTDNNGCVSSTQQFINVVPLPTITVNSGTICQGSSFVMNPGGGLIYYFTGGSATVSPMVTTSYSVTGTNANGCVSAQPAVSTVNVVNALTVTVSGATAVCMGSAGSFTASGAPNYIWNTGASTATLAPTPAANTSYTVTGFNGPCTSSMVVNVTVNALPTLSLSTANPIICQGEAVSLTASGASTYTWSTTQTGTNILVSPTTNTLYTVTGTDVNGCGGSASITQSVSACTGLASHEKEGVEASLYPNPNQGEFTIELQEAAIVMVWNSLGQLSQSLELGVGSHQLDLKEHAKGIYFIVVKQNDQTKTLKMIKN